MHVFDPRRFPYGAARRFTPGPADAAALTRHLEALGAEGVVLVQPSVYGHDHRCLVDALAALGPRARGVCVPGEAATDAELADLDARGVRGARVNLVVDPTADARLARRRIEGLIARIPPHWHVQLHVDLRTLQGLRGLIARAPCRFVLDHFGLPRVRDGVSAPHWRGLCALVADGRLSVKWSAPYLSVEDALPVEALRPFAQSLAQANPLGILWGSNWPHTRGTARAAADDPHAVEAFRRVDDRAWRTLALQWLEAWGLAPDTLDANAQRIYGPGGTG